MRACEVAIPRSWASFIRDTSNVRPRPTAISRQRPSATLPGWITVRKRRHACWFPLATSHRLAPAPRPALHAGCTVELTEVQVHDQLWWSVGFEATGSVGLLRLALQHAADLAFAQPVPAGVALSLDNSRSYAQWLNDRPRTDAAGTARPEQDLSNEPDAITSSALHLEEG